MGENLLYGYFSFHFITPPLPLPPPSQPHLILINEKFLYTGVVEIRIVVVKRVGGTHLPENEAGARRRAGCGGNLSISIEVPGCRR